MKEMKLVYGFAAALCLIGPGLISGVLAADGSQTPVTIEVLIFSGRPNPTWQLQDTNGLNRVKAKLNDLPEAFTEEPAEWSRLGFAGFRILGGETFGLSGEIRIYQGVIKTGRGKHAKYLKDSQGLEETLINEAKRRPLESVVREAIESYEKARKTPK